MSTEETRRNKVVEKFSTELAASISEENELFRAAHEAAEMRFKKRKTRIVQAHKNSKQQALNFVETREGIRKHKLQTETMQMHRNHDSGLANTEKRFAEFQATLSGENAALSALEQSARKKLGSHRKLLSRPTEGNFDGDEYQLINELRELINKTEKDLKRFRKLFWPYMVKFFAILFALSFLINVSLHYLKSHSDSRFSIAMICSLACGIVFYFLGRRQTTPLATTIADSLVRARRLHDLCFAKADSRHSRDIERIETEFKNKKQWIEEEWGKTLDEAAQARESNPALVDEKHLRVVTESDALHHKTISSLEQHHSDTLAKLQSENDSRLAELRNSSAQKEAKFQADFQAAFRALEADWKLQIEPIYESIRATNADSEKLFPPFDALNNWRAPESFEQAAKFGSLEIDLEKLAGAVPKSDRLPLPDSAQVSLPLMLTYPEQGSLLMETKEAGRDEAIAALNNVVLRLLSVSAPGKLAFTIIDPVGLGQSFSGIIHLADYAEHLINSRIWTQSAQIEEKLRDLNEHMEKVIQMYLRNEYETIADYNKQAGNIAEKYHFLVVADFPSNFTDTAAKRLLSIATSGARCGVYTLIHWDQNHIAPSDFVPDELRKSSVDLVWKGNRFTIAGKSFPGTTLQLETPPDAETVTEFVHKVGQNNRDSNRVEVPFSHVAPPDSELWTEDTTNELRVPIGRTGATKFQYLAIGKGTRQHALLAGKTGSGKSTLFHVIITNLALWCSPEQVEFYLIDFKKGVEFKCYAEKKLPHARVVAIESDREFGLSVLQRVDEELKRRGDLFRKVGAQDLAGYKRAGGTEAVPRSLLMIDEFQEFFTEDDKVSQNASVLLDRIVRQGRAFGIHVILGSQTLGGAYTMARTTIGQMVIRIALQCNEADAYLIMDENNPAPRLLSRPGEGIYNDAAGNIQGNSPFQAVWISDDVRDEYLDKVHAKAEASGKNYPAPIVFEGDAPADVRENSLLQNLLREKPVQAPAVARIWLGAPNSIKGPTEAAFNRQSGNNLLIVGQRDEAILAILSIGLVSLAAQFPSGTARVILFDANPPGSMQRDLFERAASNFPDTIKVAKQNELPDLMNQLSAELKTRSEAASSENAPRIFLFVHGLQKFGKLRYEEDFSFSSDAETAANPAAQLNKLILEGPSHGIHVVITCDTYNNVNRFLSKKAFSEIEMRVLFQMSANDSASLIDNPRAGSLGLHRAIFFNEQQGHLELFRPYALPADDWIAGASKFENSGAR
jgi:hypothetical protein